MKEARPARAKFAEARPTLYSESSTVVTDPPIARAALASHRVEYPLDVPISSTRRARVAVTSTARKEPVSRVMLSIRRGRSVVELSLALPKCSSSAIKLSSGLVNGSSCIVYRKTMLDGLPVLMIWPVGVSFAAARVDAERHDRVAVHVRGVEDRARRLDGEEPWRFTLRGLPADATQAAARLVDREDGEAIVPAIVTTSPSPCAAYRKRCLRSNVSHDGLSA